ncbi:MAG: 2-hydroxy-6-oxonona-2,4-dienedioate hydrolase [Acidimicrobiales bacterium]
MTIWIDLIQTPHQIGMIDAGGVDTRALVAGDGPDVLFLHGTSGHIEAFTRNIGRHVSAGYRCHVIDLLGHGYTAKPDYPYEIPRYVEHVLAYLDAAGIDRVHLVGTSLGGWVSAHLSWTHPDRVASLQLISSGGSVATPEVMAKIKNSTTEAVMTDDVAVTRARLELLMFDPANITDELVQIRHDVYHQPEFRQNLHNMLCLQEIEIRRRNIMTPEDLGKISAPTFVIWGSDNPFGEIPEATNIHQAIIGSRLELVAEAGHWPYYEQPEVYNALSIDFLNEVEGR